MALWLGTLIYLVCYGSMVDRSHISNVRQMLFRVNISAVAILIILGVLMVIDETNILTICNHISTWLLFLIVKVLGTVMMMALGFYQTVRALGHNRRVNRFALMIELVMGIILIFAGVMMSQINIPN